MKIPNGDRLGVKCFSICIFLLLVSSFNIINILKAKKKTEQDIFCTLNFASLNRESVDHGRILVSWPAVLLEPVPMGNQQQNQDPHGDNRDNMPSGVLLVQLDS